MNEAGPVWMKSSYSAADLACVELRGSGDGIALRNSRHPDVALPPYTRAEFAAFIAGAKDGEFDHLLD